jgi:signal transduction histidine kinase/CheY-like chemotaxis protein
MTIDSGSPGQPPQRLIPIGRSLLASSLAVAALSLALAFGGVQGLLYEPARHAVAQAELDRATRQVDAALSGLFKRVDTIARLRRDWGALGLMSNADEAGIVRLLGTELMHEPAVSSVTIADDSGREVLLRKAPDGRFRTRSTDPQAHPGTEIDAIWTPDGQLVSRATAPSDYDARQRPWFRQVHDSPPGPEVVWTAPFVFRSTGQPGLSAVVQWTTPDGRVDSSTTDLTLDDISRFTRGLEVSPRGFAVVLTDDGRLVGLPGGAAAVADTRTAALMLQPVAALGQSALVAAFERWRGGGSPPGAQLRFRDGGQVWLADFSRVALRGRASLHVAVLAPEADFALVGPRQWMTLAAILLVTIALTGWAALRAARRFARPLRELAAESERIGRLDLARPVRVASRWREVADTAAAQEAMRRGLLRATEGLEAAVERRTQQLTVAMEAAGEASRAKAAFLANMSHEIRTPMNAILGLTTLLGKTPVSDTQRDYLGRLDDAGKLLLHIVNDVLDFSKIEAGKLTLEHSEFALDDLLQRVSSVLATIARDKPLELVIRRAPDVPDRLVGDAVRLEQVLINIAGNAVKFTASGEVFVEVTLAHSSAERLEIRFSVRDTGIGMSAQQIQQLFQPFRQGDDSMARRFGGTGLGLAISKHLVELMGGSIQVESTLMAGSTFRFTLPLRAPAAGGADAGEKPWHALVDLRALVVDDNATSLAAICEILASFGIAVRGDAQPEAGIAEFTRAEAAGQGYELVLVDWSLPGTDGLEVVRRMRALAPSASAEFIMIGAEDQARAGQRLREAAVAGIVAKPATPSSLLDAILAGLGDRGRSGTAWTPPAAEPPLPGPPRHVLVVEDNEVNLLIASEFLKAAGVRVTTATGAREAIALVAGGAEFDLVFMDVQMAQMDGLEATRALRAMPRGAQLVIVALTAHAMPGDRARCLAAGMDDYLAKPLSYEALVRCLRRWLAPATTMPR